MKSKNAYVFKWGKHTSGVPWMRSLCCESRINRGSNLCVLGNPEVYGSATDTPVTLTHTQDYYCKCGKTIIRVEGTVAKMSVVGCIGFEEP